MIKGHPHQTELIKSEKSDGLNDFESNFNSIIHFADAKCIIINNSL